MKNFKFANKIVCLAISLVMLIGLVPMTAFATEDTINYVALGDSISTGYGLTSAVDDGYTYLIAKEKGYNLTNLAVDGNTASGVLSQLEKESVQASIADADIITLTVGGNDMMAYLCKVIADQYNATQSKEENKITGPQVGEIMTSSGDARKIPIVLAAMKVLTPSSDNYVIKNPEYLTELDAFIDKYNQIMSTIKELNPDVTIISATQYNPYAEFENASIKFILSISLNFAYQAAEDGVTALNTAIKNNAENGGYIVADVKAAFDEAYANGIDPYVADPSSLNLDFHPNKAGHRVLADEMLSKIPALYEKGILGDVNDDENVDVADATAIQKQSAGFVEFTNEEFLRADVNVDEAVNVSDATEIQKYVANLTTNSSIGEPIA